MRLLTEFRELVYLRRIARASERQATALETIAQCVSDEWSRKHGPRPKASPVEMGSMDVEEINKRWEKEQEAAELGEVLEE